MKGPSFFHLLDAFKEKTKYQYFCPNCNHGPFFTGSEETQCPACEVGIKLVTWADGITVEVIKAPVV